jgi:tetratricopeptide (TPR) repeat protein
MERTDNRFNDLVAEAVNHQKAGRLTEADALYRAALVLSPGHAAVTQNLGVIAATLGQHDTAIAHFDEVIAREPAHVSAHYNRAAVLQVLGRTQDAIKGFSRVCALEAGHYDAHRALGFLWLSVGERGRSLDHFARTYELRRGEDRLDWEGRSLTYGTCSKLQHDAEQFRFLADRRRDRSRFDGLAKAYDAVAKELPHQPTKLSHEQLERLGNDCNTAISIADAPELTPRAVSERPDVEDLTRRFKDAPTGVVYFDDLLTPRALLSLRRYLLESTIWHDFSHIDRFVASYLEDGLACPLLLQIIDELRSTFRDLLGEHPLSQAWAFKGLRASSAVDVHADDAAISVNFWITPTEANLNPERGGLAVCRVRPPRDWQVSGYEADRERIVAFLEQNAGDTLIVPYRENRAVLFESRLFHQSDAPRFLPTYENHRINLTFLYGRCDP